MDASTPDALPTSAPDLGLAGHTAEVVSAYVAHNSVAAADLPGLILAVHGALAGLDAPESLVTPVATSAAPVPAVRHRTPAEVEASISPDHLVSFEDGRRYRSLRRHLAGRGLTVEQYRQKWGLPADYPSTAPAYSARRSELAKAMGLGVRRRKATAAAAA